MTRIAVVPDIRCSPWVDLVPALYGEKASVLYLPRSHTLASRSSDQHDVRSFTAAYLKRRGVFTQYFNRSNERPQLPASGAFRGLIANLRLSRAEEEVERVPRRKRTHGARLRLEDPAGEIPAVKFIGLEDINGPGVDARGRIWAFGSPLQSHRTGSS